jgi:phosphohistidine phosphatase
MKTLILMRHAKAGWVEPGMDDHDRPLNKRGGSAVPVMARWMEERGLHPDRILCSSARRTRETAALMREAVPSLPAPEISAGLYLASPGALRQHLTGLPGECNCAVVIGHEPGLSSFLRTLGGNTAAPDQRRAYDHFPTAAMAVLEVDVSDWVELSGETTEFVAFVVPRELMDSPAPRA